MARHGKSHATRWPGIKHPRQRAFLEAFATNANVSAAAQAAGIDRRTYYRWAEHSEPFAQAVNVAREMALETLEAEAWRRARDGVVREIPHYYRGEQVGVSVELRHSDALLMFLLRNLAPDKYREGAESSGALVVKSYGGFDPAEVVR